MTNLFFERIQISDITPDDAQKEPAPHGKSQFFMTLIGALLILSAVGAALFVNTGQGRQGESAASQGPAKPAPLDLFP
ncbi:MAG TPA: hypothetical protein VK815_00690 [Candidatus Acidoferrales bacterium]|jgi:hypothetical protein|nr:hypothetical protein [Candidatus Acidoferrales bacterium]